MGSAELDLRRDDLPARLDVQVRSGAGPQIDVDAIAVDVRTFGGFGSVEVVRQAEDDADQDDDD